MIVGFDGSKSFLKDKTGTENYSYQLLKALLKIDQKNNYVVYVRPGAVYKEIEHHNVRIKTINWPRLWTQGGLALQTFKDQLDVLFIPAHTTPIVKKPGLKTVVTVHDLGSEYLPEMHQLKQRLYLGFMQRQQLKNASKIIAVSKSTKTDLVNRIRLNPNKIKVVYEGYDKNLFSPVKGNRLISSLKQFELKPGQYFLFVGTVQPRKNLERIIAAVNQLGEKLLIVGGKGWMSDQIYQLASDRVKFLGHVPDEKLPALYSGAIALVLPSLFEGFGLPILEAQACGCPVITSNTSSMPEVAGEGVVLVDPYKIDDIVKGMIRVNNLDIRNQLVKKGFDNIKRFSWEKCAAQTLEVLEKISLSP